MSKDEKSENGRSARRRGSGPSPPSFEDELERDYEREFGSGRASDTGARHGGPDFEARDTRAAPPGSVDEALSRALIHGRAAVAEVLAAAHALLDAIALATRGRAADADPFLGRLARLLEDLASQLATDRTEASSALFASLSDALDAEISRWEERARNDAEARAVLRAFLGVRELLWEFGVRNPGPKGEPAGPEGSSHRSSTGKTRGGPRVQRVPVEG